MITQSCQQLQKQPPSTKVSTIKFTNDNCQIINMHMWIVVKMELVWFFPPAITEHFRTIFCCGFYFIFDLSDVLDLVVLEVQWRCRHIHKLLYCAQRTDSICHKHDAYTFINTYIDFKFSSFCVNNSNRKI